MTNDVNQEEEERRDRPTKSFAISDWKKCADRLLYLPRVLKFPFFSDLVLGTCLKADWRAWMGALISVRAALRSFKLGWQQQ
jgi:hypothetical protein